LYKTLTAQHAESWQALRLEGARDFPLGFLITEEETAAVSVERCREILDNGTLRGVFDETKLVGFCGFRRERLARTRHRAQIGPFFVAQDYQGCGAAQTMMQGAIEEARSNGVEQLELFVDTENHRAIAFYERQGFERVATHPDVTRIAGKRRDDYFYRLKLGD
jgi:ribosomal protein S18 acetylase RimI-like enzyme